MNINIPKINSIFPNYQPNYSAGRVNFKSNDSLKADTFEMSVGYVNDIHGQTNNMIRILSGIKGDLRLSAGDNDIGNESNAPTHKATAQFLKLADIKASALGNHEFDTSQADLANTIRNLKTQILSVNFHKEKDWETKEDNLPEYNRTDIEKSLAKSTIVEVNGEKIGLIGASPIDMFSRTNPIYHTDCYLDDLDKTINEVQEEVNKLEKQGVNKIFLLSHLGQNPDKKIAQETNGIDVIIGGHTHELVKGIKEGENLFYSTSGEPVVMTEAGKDGAYFGLLNLTFDKNGVLTKAQNNVAETRLFYKNMVNQYIFDEFMGKAEEIGIVKQAPPPSTSLIEENPHANFMCDAMKAYTNSEIAIWNNGGIRNFFHEGTVDSRDIKDIAPFADKICVAMISEKDIVDDFKDCIKTTYESNGYKPGLMAVSGLNYTVNETTHELVEMNFIDRDGNEINIDINNPREDKFYRLVTDEYMMVAGADYKKLTDYENCLEIYPYDKDVMTCQYIKELNKPIVINQTGRIKYIK
ncbi:MAG: 5'-nucleotidase C-terminal domain-containing protein [bacterium]|nr:5'-nucleotidase C-terminal domain-containing protein [bacterium]